MEKINGWDLWRNDGSNSSFKKPFVLFHPIHDGFYYEEFENEEDVRAFATIERYNQWSKDLL